MVVWTALPEVRVYDLSIDAELEISGVDNYFAPGTGSYEALMSRLEGAIVSTWVWTDGEEEDEHTRILDPRDDRIQYSVPGAGISRRPVVADNEVRQPATGIFNPRWWEDRERLGEEVPITITYRLDGRQPDNRDARAQTTVFEVQIGDPE